jgi:hypothetical protein
MVGWVVVPSCNRVGIDRKLERRVVALPSHMNAINVISPYKYLGMWVFDDERVGLVREPLVAGIDTMIDRVVADIPNAERGFTMIFSAAPFPGHQFRLEWRRGGGGDGGNWYYTPQAELGPRGVSFHF